MAEINCDVGNCSHNQSGMCYANCVDIVGGSAEKSGDTCCSSFLNHLTYSELTNNTSGSGTAKYLNCSANTCVYNDNNLCSLDSIKVNGNQVEYYTQTDCASFKLK
ncbi:MAG: hypothetical protein H6Q74_2831 [Firmicutes bacterium]|nr:hypothetical protein [Bacillota bacterium]